MADRIMARSGRGYQEFGFVNPLLNPPAPNLKTVADKPDRLLNA